jgi:site-specific recombinase XerD
MYAMDEKKKYLSYWIMRFLLEYIISIKNLSKNTQLSYRDTFKLLIPFISRMKRKKPEELLLDDITPDNIVGFLASLEKDRKCAVSTRNLRLAALFSLLGFVAQNCPEYVEWSRLIHNIPTKKAQGTVITYLEKDEMDAMLAAPDRNRGQGKRDYALLLFLYNTGACADEVAGLKISGLHLEKQTVCLHGKGNKQRYCPLWKSTVSELKAQIKDRESSDNVFKNRLNQPLTRFGIYTVVEKYAAKAAQSKPQIAKKRVSPHTIRHTTATHLLQSGVDINTIRAWLGHVSINTTNIYAEINLKMKSEALACCEIKGEKKNGNWKDDKKIMDFLAGLK